MRPVTAVLLIASLTGMFACNLMLATCTVALTVRQAKSRPARSGIEQLPYGVGARPSGFPPRQALICTP